MTPADGMTMREAWKAGFCGRCGQKTERNVVRAVQTCHRCGYTITDQAVEQMAGFDVPMPEPLDD